MRMIMLTVTTLISLILIPSIQAVPLHLSHQGRILDSSGQPVSGQYDVTYRLFDTPTGGTALWQETQLVTVDQGLFSVSLGTNTPLDLSQLGVRPDSLWLEMQVGGDPPLSPRTMLTASPLSSVAASVNGDIKTSPGRVVSDYRDADDDDDGVTMWDSLDSSGVSIVETNATSDSNVVSMRTFQPGQPTYGNIVVQQVRSGQPNDTSYVLENSDKVRAEKFNYKQEFGPTQGTRRCAQGADTSRGYMEASAYNGTDSSSTSVDAIDDRAILKSYFETGSVPTQAEVGASTDTAFMRLQHLAGGGNLSLWATESGTEQDLIWNQGDGSNTTLKQSASSSGGEKTTVWQAPVTSDMYGSGTAVGPQLSTIWLEAAANQILNASIDVGPKNPGFPSDSIEGTLAFKSITPDLFDTTEVLSLRAGASGASMQMLTVSGDTSVTIDGGGAGGSIYVEKPAINGLGQMVKNKTTVSGYGVVGESFVLDGSTSAPSQGRFVVTPDSIALVDSSGATRAALKKQDQVALVGFGSFSTVGSDPDTAFAFDTLGNAQFAGNMSIGTSEGIAALTVAGDICYTGSIGACSDARYKTDVHPIKNALGRLVRLKGVTYQWKQDEYPERKFDNRQHIGFIAQDVEPLFPDMVMTDRNGYKSVDYSRLTPVLVESVKEQQRQIEDLKDRISSQQDEIKELQAMVHQLVEHNDDGDLSYSMKGKTE